MDQAAAEMKVGTFARTLTLAGYVITDFSRYERYALCRCNRMDVFGVTVPYLFALSDQKTYSDEIRSHIQDVAKHESRIPVFIAREPSVGSVAWTDFNNALGGAVPSWRALSEAYAGDLDVLSSNRLPPGYDGEAWYMFELAVADGLEFLFGRRVTRLGGRKRGRDLPDSLAFTPDDSILVVDSKASSEPFSVSVTSLRPLQDYVRRQRLHEANRQQVAGLLVAREFMQDDHDLIEECNRFLSDTGVPLGVLTVQTLLEITELAKSFSALRCNVSWKKVFFKVGRVESSALRKEFERAALLRGG